MAQTAVRPSASFVDAGALHWLVGIDGCALTFLAYVVVNYFSLSLSFSRRCRVQLQPLLPSVP